MSGFAATTVVAQNLPEHARNAIHTDAGARAAGFPAALVAGVTTYAYLTHPVVAAWGLEWVRAGGGEVRFRSPVHAGHTVVCVPTAEGDEVAVAARVGGAVKAELRAWPVGGDPTPMRPGEDVRPYTLRLEGEYGAGYSRRAGDDLVVCEAAGVVDPAVWPALANHVVHREAARGPWVHLRSRVTHHALAPVGAEAEVRSVVVDRSVRRSGERAVLDVQISVGGVLVASLEHEAIVALPAGA